MIISFAHKGLKLFYNEDDASKLPASQLPKIRLILTRLDAATHPEIMRVPGYRFHELSGDRKGTYSVTVTGNYRITFSFVGENAIDVNYEDYH
jgi:proteic killer suppression protein